MTNNYGYNRKSKEYRTIGNINEVEIVDSLLKIKNKTVILYSLKVLANILTVFDDDFKNINLKEVIHFYNDKCGSEALTDFEKSLIELPYLPLDNECAIEQAVYPELIDRYNKLYYSDLEDAMHNLTKSMFKFGYGSKIIPPINSNWGCKNVSVGNCTFINSNVTFVDDAKITIGDNVLIGPNVTFCTSSHPVDLENRRKIISKPITIEDGVWIGANVVILQGVTIGKNSVIGAGSIVTKNVPDNVVAFGNPCKVKKSIND